LLFCIVLIINIIPEIALPTLLLRGEAELEIIVIVVVIGTVLGAVNIKINA